MLTFPNLILNNLGTRHPIILKSYAPTFQEALLRQDLIKSKQNRLNFHHRLNIYSNHLRLNKANVIYINNHIFTPLFNILQDQNYYKIYYFIYDTSIKQRASNTPNYFNTYNDALSFINENALNPSQFLIRLKTNIINDVLGILNEDQPDDISWRQSFHGVRRALRFLKTEESIVSEYARWTLVDKTVLIGLLDYPLCLTSGFFKKIKIICHQNISHLPPEFRYFIDLGLLNGYPPLKIREMTDDPNKWLSIDNYSDYKSQWWFEQFKTTFADSIIYTPHTIKSLDEFIVDRWLWVTDGASKFSKLMLEDELIKTKLGAAVSLSDAELRSLVYNSYKVNENNNLIGVFIKPDEKYEKRRLIANLPLGIYIVFSYVRYVLNQYTGENPNFMKLSPTLSEQIDLISLIRQKRVCFPLDESAYDYHVTNESWTGFIKFLETVIPNPQAIFLIKKYFGHAIWKFEGKSGVWTSGMPSGLALTSYLNSWMNFIKQQTLVKGYINWAAGDDVLAVPYNQDITLQQVEKHYQAFGSVAHAAKNWKSNRYAEYLKTFYTTTGTTGYPSRIFSSLIWAGTERFFLPSDRLPELFELFKQFFDRVGIHMPERYVAADLSRAISNKVANFNVSTALKWIHAPKIHGGAGKLPYNNNTFTWLVEDKKISQYDNARIRMPRVIKYFGRVQLILGHYTYRPKNYRLGRTYTLPEIKTIDDWEKRLNREDIDYHGPFQSLILDTIPLPTVDFISTKQMSEFATTNRYNSYPNLTGSWDNIANRLISASYGLFENISHVMYCNKMTVLQ